MTAARRPRNIAATRAAILQSALHQFTRHGYGGVGIREIADGAGADKALIARYFGSKEGLFAEAVPATFDPTALLDGERADFGRRLAMHIVEADAHKDIDPMLATIRSLGDAAACEQLRHGLEQRFITAVAEWIGTDDAPHRAALLTAQVLGLSIAINVLSLPTLTTIGRDQLIDLIAPIFQSTIDAPHAQATPVGINTADATGDRTQRGVRRKER